MALQKFEEFKPEHGCLMLDLNIPEWKRVTSFIDKDDLDEEHGISHDPHVTVLYGYYDSIFDVDLLKKSLEGCGPIIVELGNVDLFESENYDVVKVNIGGPDIYKIHEIVKAIPHFSSFPDFKPHLTIAYVKKGLGQHYVCPKHPLLPDHLISSDLTYSSSGRKQTKITLNG